MSSHSTNCYNTVNKLLGWGTLPQCFQAKPEVIKRKHKEKKKQKKQ